MSRPVPVYHFQVEWGGARMGFSEVSGLDSEIEVIEYREGASPTYSVTKMPGLAKYPNVVLKRGIFAGDGDFADWFKTISAYTVERRSVTIRLLNEEHEPVVTWELTDAWPVKLVGPALSATTSEVAIGAWRRRRPGSRAWVELPFQEREYLTGPRRARSSRPT